MGIFPYIDLIYIGLIYGIGTSNQLVPESWPLINRWFHGNLSIGVLGRWSTWWQISGIQWGCKVCYNGDMGTICIYIYIYIFTGWWFGTWILFSISYMGWDNPSHWLSYFARWLLHHQPVYIYMYMDKLLFCDLTEMMVRKGHCAQLAQRFSNMIWYSLSNINDIVSAMR